MGLPNAYHFRTPPRAVGRGGSCLWAKRRSLRVGRVGLAKLCGARRPPFGSVLPLTMVGAAQDDDGTGLLVEDQEDAQDPKIVDALSLATNHPEPRSDWSSQSSKVATVIPVVAPLPERRKVARTSRCRTTHLPAISASLPHFLAQGCVRRLLTLRSASTRQSVERSLNHLQPTRCIGGG
jgi:hypothetical protein